MADQGDRREREVQINNIRSESYDIITESTDVKRILFYEQLYANRFDNLKGKYLKRHKTKTCSRRNK